MTAPAKNKAVFSPNLGLYYNRPEMQIPRRALVDGYNFRIKDGKLNNYNLGKTKFGTWVLNGRTMAVFTHTDRTNGDTLFLATPTDIYKYNPNSTANPITFVTPRYDTGTVAVAGTVVTGTGTLWLANAKASDQIMFGAAGYTGVNPNGNDANTKVLLHFDGADASVVFTDFNAGGAAHVWTVNGNAQVDTSQSKFGGASLQCDGTGDYITTPDAADLELGNNDWTIDTWFFVDPALADGTRAIMAGKHDAGITGATLSWYMERNTANRMRVAVGHSAGTTFNLDSILNYTATVNTGMHHMAVVRSGTTCTLYLDGVPQASTTLAAALNNNANNMSIGRGGETAGSSWFGWIDEFRLTNGTARWTAAFTPPTEAYYTPWFNVLSVTLDTTINLTASAGTITATSPYTIRKLYVTGLSDQWQIQTFLNDGADGKDRMFATNGVDWVQTWAFGDTQMTQQSGMAFKCKAIRPFSNMMQYGWLTSPTALPTSFINSDVGLPTHAGSLGTGLSEQFIAHDGTDGIDSFGILGNSLIIYSEKHIIGAQFVGSPEIFAFRKVDREVGPVGPFAVAEFGDYHEFIGADGAYRFDGVGATETNSHVMRYVRAQMGPLRRKFTYSHFIDVEGEVIWSVPAVTDPGNGVLGTPPVVGWTEHYLEDVGPQVPRPFSKRNWPYTASGHWTNATNVLWSSMTLTWADYSVRWIDQSNAASSVQELAGDETGQIWIINTVQDANGVNLDSYVQFPRFPTGNLREKSMLQRWYPFSSPGIGNLTVTTLYSNFATGVLIGDGGLSFDTTQSGNDFVSPMRKARYTALKVGSNNTAYQFEGYDYEIALIEGGVR